VHHGFIVRVNHAKRKRASRKTSDITACNYILETLSTHPVVRGQT